MRHARSDARHAKVNSIAIMRQRWLVLPLTAVTLMTIKRAENARILVVEDDGVTADLLRFNLERAGFSVSVVHDGRRAIERLKESRFDLIITDYQMPHVNGEDLCRHVRMDDWHNVPALSLFG